MANDLAEVVPGQLRAELARRQMTKSQLAEKLQVSDMWVYRRLTGLTAINLGDLDRIVKALDLDVHELLDGAA